jgi:Helix-turn-helix domain
MSTDYYTRLEQQRGPQPSEQMLASLARALRLTSSERDYLFRVAGTTRRPRCRRPRTSPRRCCVCWTGWATPRR